MEQLVERSESCANKTILHEYTPPVYHIFPDRFPRPLNLYTGSRFTDFSLRLRHVEISVLYPAAGSCLDVIFGRREQPVRKM